MQRSELLKIQEGSAIDPKGADLGTITLKNDLGFLGCDISRASLQIIINQRVCEIFELVRKDIEGSHEGMIGMLRAGVMITGGSSRLRGIATVAEDVFEIPAHLTRAKEVGGATQTFENPQFSTAIGLTKYAMAVSENIQEESVFEKLTKGIGGIFRGRSR